MIPGFWHDIRYGLRMLRRSPGFTAAAAITLALAIGANTAIFSLADAVLFRPFPVREPNRLTVLYTRSTTDGKYASTSYLDFADYRELKEIFDGLTAYWRAPFAVSNGSHTERLWGEIVSADYFDVLGLNVTPGRRFMAADDTPEAQPVAIISDGLWRRSFGADPNIVGRPVMIDGRNVTVAGVAPRAFRGVTLDWGQPPDVWIPLRVAFRILPWWPRQYDVLQSRDARAFLVVGRLRPGITIEHAQAVLRVRARQRELAYPQTNRGWSVTLLPASEARFWPDYRKPVVSLLELLISAVGFVLLIACVNVSNLLLARSTARQREVAIRVALGAGRFRLLRQMAAESLLLSLLGLALSFPIAVWLLGLISRFPLPFQVPLALDLSLDPRVFLFALLVALVTTLVFGLLPALQASRPDLRSALQQSGSPVSPTQHSSRLRSLLAAAQVALSVILLAGAGLFLRTLQKTAAIDPGFNPDNVLVLSLDFNSMRHRYDDAKGMEFYRRLLDQVRALPGVRSATWAGDVPLALRRLIVLFSKGDQANVAEKDRIQIECNVVGPRYLETLGIPLVRGRDFTDRDNETVAEVAIVNESMARIYWPGQDPLGQRIRVYGRAREIYEIVGVAKDVRQRSLFSIQGPYLYLPLYQRYFPEMMLHVRTAGDPMTMLPAVRREIEAMDPDLPAFDAGSLSSQIDRALSAQRMAAALLSASGGLALVLAVVGIYGVMGYGLALRAHEFGIRIALGAERSSILNLVLVHGAAILAVGLGAGLISALAMTRMVAGFLYGVSPADPATLAAVSIAIAAATMAACYIPARRASKIDPLPALRQE